MEEDAKKVKGFKAYNILPLETPGVANVFQSFPEVNLYHKTALHESIQKTGPFLSLLLLSWFRLGSAYLGLKLSAFLD